ncbi:MAG: lipopolysaccharide biosynthesis, partial [Pseudomonadota bacterium]
MKLLVESPQIPDELAPSTARIPAHEQLQIVEQRLLTRANLLDIARDLKVLTGQDEMTPDRIVKSMRARTQIGIDRFAPLMTITFEAPSGKKAAEVLGEYLTLIQQEDVQARTGRATQTLQFFEQEVSRLNEQLANRSAQILEFKTSNSDALPESLDYRLSQQTVLQERLALQERELHSLEDQRERLIDIFQSTGEFSRIGDQPLSPERQELEALQKQLSDALAIYSQTHPRVKILSSRIDRLTDQINAKPVTSEEEVQVSSGNTMLDVQLAELDARAATLNRQLESTQKQLAQLSESIARTPTNAIRLDEL